MVTEMCNARNIPIEADLHAVNAAVLTFGEARELRENLQASSVGGAKHQIARWNENRLMYRST